MPGGRVRMPGARVRMPGARVRMPGGIVRMPGGRVRMPGLYEEDTQREGLGGETSPTKTTFLHEVSPNVKYNASHKLPLSLGDNRESSKETSKEKSDLFRSSSENVFKQKCSDKELGKDIGKKDNSASKEEKIDTERESDEDVTLVGETESISSNEELNNDKGEAGQIKEVETDIKGSNMKLLQKQRIWQKQEENMWLEQDLEGQIEERDQDHGESSLPNGSGEEEKEYVQTIKIEKNVDPKQTIGDMRIVWEKQFVQLMNEIENLDSIAINNRTEDEEDALKKMRKKYHKKKGNYPHLARTHLSESVNKIGKNELDNPDMKSEEFKKVTGSLSYFGSGTISSPVVKFYFTAPCPQLGIEAGCEPSLGGRPVFLASQLAFTCRLCQEVVSSGLELVEHWRKEVESQGELLPGEKLAEEQLDIPHAEVRPPQISTNENMDLKFNIPGGIAFDCTDCDYRSNRMNSLQRHIHIVHSNELVYCDKCAFKCTKKDTLRAHRHRKHRDIVQSNELIYCDKCEFTCTNKNTLRAHRIRKHTDIVHSTELICCDKCEFKCTKRDTLRVHRNRKHKDGKHIKFEAETEVTQNCTKSVHIKLDDASEQPFPCSQCDLKAKNKKTLRKHTIKEHKQSKVSGRALSSVQCEDCEYSCTKSKVLAMHKYRKHNGILPEYDYLCNLCGYKCSKGEMLSIHLFKKHNGEAPEPRSCNKCEYTTPWTSHMRNHMDKHNGKIRLYYCDQCDFSNKNKFVLRHHNTLKHGKEATVPCDLCGFKTSSAAYLKVHIGMKHSTNVFMCDQCEFKSTYWTALKNHTRIHDKQTWFQCESCSYRTPAKGNLKTHNESKHMGIQHPCPKCTFLGYNKNHLKLHTDTVHLDTAPI